MPSIHVYQSVSPPAGPYADRALTSNIRGPRADSLWHRALSCYLFEVDSDGSLNPTLLKIAALRLLRLVAGPTNSRPMVCFGYQQPPSAGKAGCWFNCICRQRGNLCLSAKSNYVLFVFPPAASQLPRSVYDLYEPGPRLHGVGVVIDGSFKMAMERSRLGRLESTKGIIGINLPISYPQTGQHTASSMIIVCLPTSTAPSHPLEMLQVGRPRGLQLSSGNLVTVPVRGHHVKHPLVNDASRLRAHGHIRPEGGGALCNLDVHDIYGPGTCNLGTYLRCLPCWVRAPGSGLLAVPNLLLWSPFNRTGVSSWFENQHQTRYHKDQYLHRPQHPTSLGARRESRMGLPLFAPDKTDFWPGPRPATK